MITQYSYGLNTRASQNNNVREIWKTWSCEEIRADLQKNRSGMVNICQNLTSDFNKGTIIRSNNAFLGRSVYIVGKKKYDKRGAVGTYHLETVYHADTFDEVFNLLKKEGYLILAVDNIEEYNPIALSDVKFPYSTAFVYGEENAGLSKEIIDKCDAMIYIKNIGSVRSMNVGCAASYCMYEYFKQWG